MWAKHPEIAKRWAHEYPGQHDLPKHKKGKKHHMPKEASVMNTPFLANVAEAMEVAGAALTKAEAAEQMTKKAAADYASKIPSVIEACVKGGRIDDTPGDREKLASWLASPQGALEVIEKLADHIVEAPAPTLQGQQVDAQGRPASNGHTKRASFEGGGRVAAREASSEAWDRMRVAILGR